MRLKIGDNLGIDLVRVRYFDPGIQSSIGVVGDRWQIWYPDQWQDLPWHFDGPLTATRELVRKCEWFRLLAKAIVRDYTHCVR